MLGAWNGEEHMQIQENRTLVKKASEIISQKAYTLVDQAIEKILQDWKLRDTQAEGGGLGRGPRGALASEQGVSALGHPARMR